MRLFLIRRGAISASSSASSSSSLTRFQRHSRPFSSSSGTTEYIDHWFRSIQKPASFYEDAAYGKPRRYFYNIDFQGRLFLEETTPKNIATSIKDDKFLDFFFSRVRTITEREQPFLLEHECFEDYPFVSLCGHEVNYIRPAAVPIVFHSLINHNEQLIFGGSLSIAFDASQLAISKDTGKLYHRLDTPSEVSPEKKNNRNMEELRKLGFGLIRSSVAVALSDRIQLGASDDDHFLFCDDEKETEIDWLPPQFEPGSWAMPNEA